MDTSTRSWYGLVVLATLTGACISNPQTREGRIPGERRDCRAAAAQVATGKAVAKTFTTLAWCDETGPDALASVWRGPLPGTSRLDKFLFASGNIRDARIFDAAFAAASKPGRPAAERGAALLVLVAQLDSSSTVGLAVTPRNEPWRAGLARETHPMQLPGRKPLPADAQARVTALARALRAGLPTGAVGLRDPLRAAVYSTELALQRLPRASSQTRTAQRNR
jgi:hypothetical protein